MSATVDATKPTAIKPDYFAYCNKVTAWCKDGDSTIYKIAKFVFASPFMYPFAFLADIGSNIWSLSTRCVSYIFSSNEVEQKEKPIEKKPVEPKPEVKKPEEKKPGIFARGLTKTANATKVVWSGVHGAYKTCTRHRITSLGAATTAVAATVAYKYGFVGIPSFFGGA